MATEKKYQQSVEVLNKAVAEEITAVLQYIYFHVHCEDMGYRPLAQFFMKVSIQEMKHIEELSERILFLEGDVNMNIAKPVQKIRDVEGMLKYAMELEKATIEDYNQWSKETGDAGDAGTHKMFQDLVVGEEEHMDAFRTELDNMKMYGDNYLALQAVLNIKHEAKE